MYKGSSSNDNYDSIKDERVNTIKLKNMKNIKFAKDSLGILRELKKRVDRYFIENNIKKTGNASLYFKTGLMLFLFFSAYTLPYLLSLNIWGILFAASLAVFSGLGLGMSVMHDANHGVFSENEKVNKVFGAVLYLLGGNVFNWKKQHNDDHHMGTNINGEDPDMESQGYLRLSLEQPWKPIHQFQAYYAVAVYACVSLYRFFAKDFIQMNEYMKKSSLSSGEKKKEQMILYSTKILYSFFWLALPLVYWKGPWWYVLVFFITMHALSSVVMTIVFAVAHLVPKAETLVSEELQKDPWVVHQLKTSCNFGTKNRFLRWYMGGLTHQKEHHVFPRISHIHYKDIEIYFRAICRKISIPYIEYSGFWKAVAAHFSLLHSLGRKKIN